MKLLRKIIRSLILESEEEQFLPTLIGMVKAGHEHLIQAKELASSLGLNVNLDVELMKLIKQQLDPLLAKAQSTYPWIADIDETSAQIQVYSIHPAHGKENWGLIYSDDKGINFKDELWNDPIYTFDTVDALIAHLYKNLEPWFAEDMYE
jgi:hypothetical protein